MDFLALRAGRPPRRLAASVVLEELTPVDLREAVEKVRFGQNLMERTEAVAAIVQRRQRLSVRVREEEATYSASPRSDRDRSGGGRGRRALMSKIATMHEGPLGSTIHVLRADPDTVAALAAVEWHRHFRRVWLDPGLGIIALMAPSHKHEDLTELVDRIVDEAGSAVMDAVKGLRSLRLRGQGEPPGTRDGARLRVLHRRTGEGLLAARREGDAAVTAFVERTAPDLVVETEITSFDEGKIERYADLGARELWRLHGRKGSDELRVDFLALRTGRPPRRLTASRVLAGLTPADVCEAVEKVSFAETRAERTEAVSAIVLRRQRLSARVREEEAPNSANPVQPETATSSRE